MKNKHLGELVLDEQQIHKGVKMVAQKLNEQYSDAVIVTVVPGGILFTADLVRHLSFDIRMDYISCPHKPGERDNKSEIVFHENISGMSSLWMMLLNQVEQ